MHLAADGETEAGAARRSGRAGRGVRGCARGEHGGAAVGELRGAGAALEDEGADVGEREGVRGEEADGAGAGYEDVDLGGDGHCGGGDGDFWAGSLGCEIKGELSILCLLEVTRFGSRKSMA